MLMEEEGIFNCNVCSSDLQYLRLYSKRCDGSDSQGYSFYIL